MSATEDSEHTFTLPHTVPVMQCTCRRAWLRLLDGERATDQYGAVLHVSADGWFRCCQRRWQWAAAPPQPQPQPHEGGADAAGNG